MEEFEFIKIVKEAKQLAIKEGLKANVIFINEKFAKTPALTIPTSRSSFSCLPPMIMGLEVDIAKELPDNVLFAVTEVPETHTEKITKQYKHEGVAEFVRELEELFAGDETIRSEIKRVYKEKYENGQSNEINNNL